MRLTAPAAANERLRLVAERARATEAKLADAQTRLELTLAAAEVGTWLWDAVNDRVVADRNLSLMFGLPPGGEPGVPLADFLRSIHAGDLRRVQDAIAATLRDGAPYEMQYRVVAPSGAIRWILARGRLERDQAGEVLGLHGVALDVTDRVRAEDSRRELADKVEQQVRVFETTLSSITDFAYIFDKEGRFLFVNQALLDLWGLPLDQAVGRNFFDLRYPDDLAAKLHRQIQDVFANGQVLTDETPYTSPTGAGGFYEYIFVPVRARDGTIEVVAGSTRDITSRKAAEQRLERLLVEQQALQAQNAQLLEAERVARAEAERLNHLKDEFLATLSHELRTPLNSILGWAEFLEGPTERALLAEGLSAIGRNARLQAQMIEELLDLSRIVSGTMQLNLTSVGLQHAISQTMRAIYPTAAEKGIRLTVTFEGATVAVEADPERLQQVLWNLIANAIKFTPPGGTVEVRVANAESTVEICVADTGEGIDPVFIPYVFERFRQADPRTARKHGGLGIGLSIVKQLIELHGGTVRASSGGKGAGAQFVVSLPRARGGRPDAGTRPQATTGLQFNGVRILVVDDDEDARVLVLRILESRGAKVTSSASGAAALAVLSEQPVDLLICDIGMPLLDGYELIRKVRTLPAAAGGRVPAVALTAYARSEDQQRAVTAGFHAHVPKPVDQSRLLRVCADLVQI